MYNITNTHFYIFVAILLVQNNTFTFNVVAKNYFNSQKVI